MTNQENPQNFWHRRNLRIDEILESWRTATTHASGAIKSAILLNGAAAIAVLAFIGAMVGKGPEKVDVSHLIEPLHHFLIGALSAAIASGTAYLAARAENIRLWAWATENPHGNWFLGLQNVFECAAIILIIFSYMQFWWGMDAGIAALN